MTVLLEYIGILVALDMLPFVSAAQKLCHSCAQCYAQFIIRKVYILYLNGVKWGIVNRVNEWRIGLEVHGLRMHC